ncbi:glycine betaine ABC transporter substrate-binding protein [Dongshaea marina]|uniref:glycine betaine ABC transporter substrate-binding protein n=1 Tax=Dongshaea marina TaxID=2047966 RepID=UPI001901C4A1|nr:glycine betaine ABC transporter substrate-binding protein [Dongshaea marina]
MKMAKKIRLCLVGGLVVLSALGLSACNKEKKAEQKKTAKLVYVNWAEGVAYTHLAKVVLTDKMGYDVSLTAADVGPAYISVAQGKYDALMESWPDLQQSYIKRFGNKLDNLGSIYKGTEVGLVVPEYVNIDSISQLKANAAKFNNQIVGIDAGAGMMNDVENKIIPEYGLTNMKLLASSGPAMTAALGKAIEKKQWIVVTGWVPHWMFSRWHLKFLKQDPSKLVWKKGEIDIMGRSNLGQDKPELKQFLTNMYLTDQQLSGLILAIKDKGEDQTIDQVARQWMKSHEKVVNSWIPKHKAA